MMVLVLVELVVVLVEPQGSHGSTGSTDDLLVNGEEPAPIKKR